MLRAIVALSVLLLTPLAAASGPSLDADVLPDGTMSCADDSYSNYTSDSWWGNDSYWYRYDGQSYQREGCDWEQDTVAANVTSNGHGAAAAVVGSEGGSEQTSSTSESGEGSGWSYEGSSGRWSSEQRRSFYHEESSSSSGAAVDTFTGGASYADGCADTRDSSTSSSYSSDHYNYGESRHYAGYADHDGWHTWSSGCAKTATVDTDVTTLAAQSGDRCSGSGSDSWSSYYHEDTYGGGENNTSTIWSEYSNAGSWSSRSECFNGASASAGEADAAAGTRSDCTDWTYTRDATYSGRDYAEWHECESRTGVFGPDGLAVYYGSEYWSSCYGQDWETCVGESGQQDRVAIEHDLVGAVWWMPPTLPPVVLP